LVSEHGAWKLDVRQVDRLDVAVFRTLVDRAAQFGADDPLTAVGLL
jgi:hypothetical protein